MFTKGELKIAIISFFIVFLIILICVRMQNSTDKEITMQKKATTQAEETEKEIEETTEEITEKKTEKETEKETEKKTEKKTEKETEKKTKKETEKQTEETTERKTQEATQKQTQAESKPMNYYDEQFNGDAFIGDSRTEGLLYASQVTTADFLCGVGFNVKTVMKEGSVMGPLEENKYRNIYIEFGVNELGWGSLDAFEESYDAFVKRVKKLQPDANIYVQSIIPVTQSKSDSNTSFTLERVELFNERVIKVVKKNKVIYLDTAEALCGKSRILPEEVSSDGVHLNREFCLKWLDFLISERKN